MAAGGSIQVPINFSSSVGRGKAKFELTTVTTFFLTCVSNVSQLQSQSSASSWPTLQFPWWRQRELSLTAVTVSALIWCSFLLLCQSPGGCGTQERNCGLHHRRRQLYQPQPSSKQATWRLAVIPTSHTPCFSYGTPSCCQPTGNNIGCGSANSGIGQTPRQGGYPTFSAEFRRRTPDTRHR